MQKSLQSSLITLFTILLMVPVCFAQSELYDNNFDAFGTDPNGVTHPGGWTSSNGQLVSGGNKNTNYTLNLSTNTSTVNFTNVTVTWDGSAPVNNGSTKIEYINNTGSRISITINNLTTTSLELGTDANGMDKIDLSFTFRSKDNSTNPYTIDNLKITATPTPLPVSLISFTGKAETGKNILNWATATEKNNDRFEIQRSLDGKNFNFIGEVKPATGNSNTIRTYSFTDQNASGEVSYYRLKQVDFDGKYEYSSIIAVRNSQSIQISVYPNLVEDFIHIQLPKTLATEQTLEIVNIKGTVVKKFTTSISNNLNVEDLTPGIYFIKVAGATKYSLTRFVKL